MKKINDGRPAFPQMTTITAKIGNDTHIMPQITGGMSLRAYFAGQIMMGYCANPSYGDNSFEAEARAAIQQADALITELERTDETQTS